jgi:hypothetical protein
VAAGGHVFLSDSPERMKRLMELDAQRHGSDPDE